MKTLYRLLAKDACDHWADTSPLARRFAKYLRAGPEIIKNYWALGSSNDSEPEIIIHFGEFTYIVQTNTKLHRLIQTKT